jgi:nitroreductase
MVKLWTPYLICTLFEKEVNVEFYDVIRKRRSIRKYKPDPIPEAILKNILDAGRIAPSAKNYQPWRFIVVKDPDKKKQIVAASRNQQFVGEAAVIVVGCALVDTAWGRMGGYMSSWSVDLTIALDHIILAAVNEGLGTCWIGAFDEAEVKRILHIPDPVRVLALTPVGYPDDTPPERGRKSADEILSYDTY